MLTDRITALSAYLVRIQENRERLNVDSWDAFKTAIAEEPDATPERWWLCVRLECIRRARIRSGATCP